MGCGPSSAANAAAPRPGMVERQVNGGGNPHNRRVRPVQPWSMPESVSNSQLVSKRDTFWQTAPQAGGRRAVWDNLRLISETILAGDLELATTLVQAADLRIPHADLSLVYDSTGRSYELPRFVYSNPTNLLSDEALASKQAAELAKSKDHKGPVTDMPVIIRISPSPGTGVDNNGNSEQDLKLTVRSDTRVGQLKTMVHEKLLSGECDQAASAEVKKPNRWAGKGLPIHRQRLMLRGRELSDVQHMQECGAEAGSVLQIFVRPEIM